MNKLLLFTVLALLVLITKAQQEAICNYTNTPITIDGDIVNDGEWGNWDALLEKRSHTSAYAFDNTISQEVLLKYLSRSATFNGLAFSETLYDDLRLIKNLRPKFLGRISYVWSRWTNSPGRPNGIEIRAEELFSTTKSVNQDIHSIDPDIITQSCIFEIVDEVFVGDVQIPDYVFTDFDLPVEDRTFNYNDMLYSNGSYVNFWYTGGSVPDITRQETQFWFYYMATQYINAGVESIHMGQIDIMNNNDDSYNSASFSLFAKIRDYAHIHARRHLVLIDAHVTTGGIVDADDNLLFDFHAFPQRIKNDCSKEHQLASCPEGDQYWAYLIPNFHEAIYNRSKGGTAPSGWACESLPYIVEFDNYGNQSPTGECNASYWPWGWDEVSWFANCSPEYRAYYVQYAYDRVHELDPGIGNLEMPLKIPMNVEEDHNDELHYRAWYRANHQSPACPLGLSVEATIKSVWGELTEDTDLESTINGTADTFQQVNSNGESDNTILWKSRWDEDYLYLAVLVSDDTLIGPANHIDPNSGDKFKSDRLDMAIGNKSENYGLDMTDGDETPTWWDPNDVSPDGWGIPDDDIFGGTFLLNSRVELVNANDDFKGDKLEYVIKYHPNIRVENGDVVSGFVYEARIPWITLTTVGESTYIPEVDNKLIFDLVNGDAENTVDYSFDFKSWGQTGQAFISLNQAGFLVFKDEDVTSSETSVRTNNISVYPNPVKGILTIKGATDLCCVSIYDVCGKQVLSERINSNTIDVSTLEEGIYVLYIESKKINSRVKFVRIDK